DFVPVRLQSACAYGEVLGAADCDCRAQLDASYAYFKAHHAGILIHLDQEGRGAGLHVKAKAYQLQDDEHLDTVEAYSRLGIEPDQRNYQIAAAILKNLGVKHALLLTNNPRKIHQLEDHHIKIARAPLHVPVTRENQSYLQVKRDKLGHSLDLQIGAPRR